MGILNATPDSFSDGGRFVDLDAAVKHARHMVSDGADIVDVGGESTRPGSKSVPIDIELSRVIPLIGKLVSEVQVLISIDTSKPEVMKAAVEAGANMINDVWALRRPGALNQASELGVLVCLMHMQGEPATMQRSPQYENVLTEVKRFLQKRIERCIEAGVSPEKIVVDPGIGFGKTPKHNRDLIDGLKVFGDLGSPILVGVSRKSFLPVKSSGLDREKVSADYALRAVVNGASIVRVHNVGLTAKLLRTREGEAVDLEDPRV